MDNKEKLFEKISWEEVKNNDFNLVLSQEEKVELFKRIGYTVTEKGFLVDEETGEKIESEDGEKINIKKDKKLALIAGSHNFVKGVAGYSNLLAEKGQLEVVPKSK